MIVKFLNVQEKSFVDILSTDALKSQAEISFRGVNFLRWHPKYLRVFSPYLWEACGLWGSRFLGSIALGSAWCLEVQMFEFQLCYAFSVGGYTSSSYICDKPLFIF